MLLKENSRRTRTEDNWQEEGEYKKNLPGNQIMESIAIGQQKKGEPSHKRN